MSRDNIDILIKKAVNTGVNSDEVEELSKKALKERGYSKDVELSVIFVGRKKAKELNQLYRGMDYIPQVLGFPMSREKDADGKIRLGDIVICTQKLKYEAKYQKKSERQILGEWLAHGLDNLLK